MKWFLGALGVLGAGALALTSCGRDVCVFGQGDCEQEILSTNLSLAASSATVALGATLTFTPTGGTQPYNFSIVVPSSGGGSVSPTTGTSTVFTAPSTAQTVCVRVTDNNSAIADRCVTVQ